MELSEVLGGTPAPAVTETPPTPQVDTPAPTPPVEAPPPQEPATTAEPRARDEHGRFVANQPAQPQPPPEDRQPQMVPVQAMLEERRKRQELEARLRQREAPPELPPVTDDQFFESPVKATQALLERQRQEFERQRLTDRFNQGEFHLRQTAQDFDQVKEGFIAALERDDPVAAAIYEQSLAHPSPPAFIYQEAKRLQQYRQLSEDPAVLTARLEREAEARVIARMQAEGRAVPAVPKSLNSIPSERTSSTPESFEPTPLGSIVKFNF